MYCRSDGLELENLRVYCKDWPGLSVEPMAWIAENGISESIVNPKLTWLMVVSRMPVFEILRLMSNSA
jgi:hypothetical protein